jgi:Ion channel
LRAPLFAIGVTQMPKAATARRPGQGWEALRRPGQFTILLAAILGFLLVPAFFMNYKFTGLLANVFLSVVLLSVLYVFPSRRELTFACILAVPTLAGRWLLGYHDNPVLMVAVMLCWVVFLGLTALVILRQVLGATRVTNDTISGAVCGYLLLGIIFAFLYAVIGLLYPGSFITAEGLIKPELGRSYYQREINNLIYYSFVTLATLGYGDIAPASAPARALAMIEAVAGQFYVAILIARLVSIRYSRWGAEE